MLGFLFSSVVLLFILVLEFVKVLLILVCWIACISLACGSVYAWWLFGAFSSLDEFFAR